MSSELKVFKLFCSDREVFEKYSPYISVNDNMDRDLKLLFSVVKGYYKQYSSANNISVDDIKSFYDLSYAKSKDRQEHMLLIEECFGVTTKDYIIKDLLEQIVERHTATRIINSLVPVVEGNKFGVVPKIQNDVDTFVNLMQNPPQNLTALAPNKSTVAELIQKEIANEGLYWHIDSLNQSIQRLRRRTLGLIFAYVDVGKTSFGIGACANFLKQLKATEEKIVYAGNEEAGGRTNLRVTQALLGVTSDYIHNNPEEVEEARTAQGFNNLLVFDSVTDYKNVVDLLEEYRPRVMIIDQATKVDMRISSNETSAIRIIFNNFRELAKKYDNSIIGLAQGVGSSENEKWLKLSDIYSSRVAIQGELDYAIGIGRVLNDASKEFLRYLNVCKNKFGDNSKTVVHFQKESCLWKPIM